jgi:hypothetical protein
MSSEKTLPFPRGKAIFTPWSISIQRMPKNYSSHFFGETPWLSMGQQGRAMFIGLCYVRTLF